MRHQGRDRALIAELEALIAREEEFILVDKPIPNDIYKRKRLLYAKLNIGEGGISLAEAIDHEPINDEEPERFEKFRAPPGGMIVENMFYPGGRILPLEATGQAPKRMAATDANRPNPLLNRSFVFVGFPRKPHGADVAKFDAKNQDEAAAGPSNVRGYGFSSPNTKPMGGFPEAKKATGEDEQKKHVRDVEDTLLNFGIPKSTYKVYNAIGDWGLTPEERGAENSSVHVVQHDTDWKTLRKVAAKIGHLKKQSSVLAFMPEASGQHMIHRLYIPAAVSDDKIREALESANIFHRTIVPAPDGAHVVFVVEPFGIDPSVEQNLKDIAKKQGDGHVDSARGRASFVGEESRGDRKDWKFEPDSRLEYERILRGDA